MKILATPKSGSAIKIEDRFYPKASDLRAHFERTFENPLKASSDRFCWDYWTIPGQYRLLRTPAETFFGPKLFQPFLNHLLAYGRNTLGCQMISEPWLSSYVDGCFQNIHSDVPHGPLSFVFSLSPKKASFSGGNTFVAKPKLLSYFTNLDPHTSHEKKDLIETIAPKFNRLTVFDPRYPHGVEPVSNVESILDSRLVIHGWFTEPRPMVEGALTVKKVIKPMDQIAEILMHELDKTGFKGLLALQIEIEASGKIKAVKSLTSHLVKSDGSILTTRALQNLFPFFVRFPSARGRTSLRLPIQLL